jgi:drug/metabolite transporter (DMT)-like permease
MSSPPVGRHTSSLPAGHDRAPSSGMVAVAALVGVAIVYGATYSTMKGAVTATDPLGFLAARFGIGALVLWPFVRRRPRRAGELKAGLAGGVALWVGYTCQAVGLKSTTSAASALALNLMVIVIPVANAVLAHRLPRLRTMGATVGAAIGVHLMAGGGLGDRLGIMLSLAAAIAFAAHVLICAATASCHDPLRLTAIQLGVVAVGCTVLGFGDGVSIAAVETWPAAVALGVVASAGAISLQLWAQRSLEAPTVAVTMCLEAVVALGVGYYLGEPVAGTAGWGVLAVLLAIVITATDKTTIGSTPSVTRHGGSATTTLAAIAAAPPA